MTIRQGLASRLRHLFRRSARSADDHTAEALGDLLDIPMAEVDTRALWPVIVPREFADRGDWPGPIERIGIEEVDLTWVVRGEPNLIRYVSWELSAFWDEQGFDWRARAMANLASAAQAHPYSGEFRDSDDQIVIVALMHDDGLGPSRLLVPGLLKEIFPGGYDVAIPELTCAIAFARRSENEDPRIAILISQCYEHGTRPLSPLRYRPEEFWPASSQSS